MKEIDMNAREEKMVLMDERRIERTLNRMAHQVVEDVEKGHKLRIVGIQERGYAISVKLTNLLDDIYGQELECYPLAVKNNQQKEEHFDVSTIDPDRDFILLVDDVIFSGTTMFRAMLMLAEQQLPDHLHCAVLIDRGHRQLPVTAEYIGMSIPTKLNEHVAVEVSKEGGLEGVNLFF